MGFESVGRLDMKTKRNKRGFYEKDNDQLKEWLLVLVVMGIVLIGFSYHLFKIIF